MCADATIANVVQESGIVQQIDDKWRVGQREFTKAETRCFDGGISRLHAF